MGFGSFLRNPLQPITHAIGKTAGLTASLHGVHVDPMRLATTAMALGGNPFAMAGVAGNAASTIAPGSEFGKIGDMVGNLAPMAAGATGGMGAVLGKAGGFVSKIPGGGKGLAALSSLIGHGGGSAGAGGSGGDDPTKLGTFSNGSSDPTSMIGITPGMGDSDVAGSGGGDSSGNGGSWLDKIMGGVKHYGQEALGSLTEHGGDNGGSGGGGFGAPAGINPMILEGLAGAQGISGALASKRQGQLQDQALKTATDNYAGRAPLRAAGVAAMTAPPVKLNVPQTGNPFQAQSS